MKKKIVKIIGLLLIIALAIVFVYNCYVAIVSGEQNINISTSTKAYSNSDYYISIVSEKKGLDLATESKVTLLDSKGKAVKNARVKYDGNTACIHIPNIEEGEYKIKAKVSSKAGKDVIEKSIQVYNSNNENVTISFDKGIYKPGDVVNYRALLTNVETDEPVTKDVNICIYDGNNNKVYNENVKSSDYGILSGSFVLASEVNSGLYKIVIKTDESETTKQFKVNPYIIPKYEVKIKFDKDSYLVGDTADIRFNTQYFFGEPVKDANLTVYIDNLKYKNIKTDENGEAKLEYPITSAKKYDIKVEAVDSSNYYVEATNSFTAGTDLFEIELLPEYKSLISGKKNDIYVFTNKADGTPLKTYVTINSGKFTKQIVTDEKGIGKFSIDIEASETKTKKFSIVADDTKGNIVTKDEVLIDIATNKVVLSTDKIKYNQGDDIKVDVSSIGNQSKNIYVLKNDKLLKMMNTESEDFTINLGDTYGLIDFYVSTSNNDRYNYDKTYNTYKRTIFIKPNKELMIDVKTDKDEYKPGEKITISFDAKDENKSGVDAALLVSMLDNSVLNLASNDLSIDNIKLALQDIEFSDDLDAASLYSSIIDDNSEQTLMALLLKQSQKNSSISEESVYGYSREEQAGERSVIFALLLILAIFIFLAITSKKIRGKLRHIPNIVIFEIAIASFSLSIIEEFYMNDLATIFLLWVLPITSLAIYILVAPKIKEEIFNTSYSLFGLIPCLLLLMFLYEKFDVPISIGLVALAVIFLILVVLWKIFQKKNNKISKIVGFGIKLYLIAIKTLLVVIVSAIFGSMIEDFTELYYINIPVAIVMIYFIDYYLSLVIGKKINPKNIISDGSKKAKDIAIAIFVPIGIISTFIFIGILINNMASNSISEAGAMVVEDATNSSTRSKGINAPKPNDFSASDSSGAAAGSGSYKSILSAAESFIGTGSSPKRYDVDATSNLVSNDKTTVSKTDDNVRNVFLESMCFIPELVINNGSGKIDLNLSDNITTWTIQTVGNTRDGRIGYGILDSVKVFKEFFVDFELPKNMVEGDKVSIPVTVYNYTDNPISTMLKIQQADWFSLENNNVNVNINPQGTSMVYIPIKVLKAGDNKFRAEVSSNSLSDIVEKECIVNPNGYKIEKVVSTGNLNEDVSEDILFLDEVIENTAKAKVKIYPSAIAQTIEGMENIFRMPTGCFEQVSSSLYPDIVALKYMEDNNLANDELKEKALSYISSGYQKLLTYEVPGESGGYSLYGHTPAETVLTAYGLMEMVDLSEVYNVDEKVISKMTEYLYKKQDASGKFEITGNHVGGANSRSEIGMNAYIVWALSESNPKDSRLKKSVEYLKSKIDENTDSYVLALYANILANTKDKELKNVLPKLTSKINVDEDSAYITSNMYDYYGSRSNVQSIQTVALTSLALSKSSYSNDTNKLLINYLMSKVDSAGTWYSTQATVLALKALNENNQRGKLENQTIKVKMNSDEKVIDIKENSLEYYEISFDKLSKENKLSIDVEKGNAYYEVVEEYYIPYEKVDTKNDNITVSIDCNEHLKVNEILKSNIKVINNSDDSIANGMVTISIPQGFTVVEESLMLLETDGLIEKYEMTYTSINIYLRDFDSGEVANLDVQFRAGYPVEITGMAVRAYDYYNPMTEGKAMPRKIVVTQ